MSKNRESIEVAEATSNNKKQIAREKVAKSIDSIAFEVAISTHHCNEQQFRGWDTTHVVWIEILEQVQVD